jgi:hypothetical protein
MALKAVMFEFHDNAHGSREFWEKCFVLLDNIMKQSTGPDKLWRPLKARKLVQMIKILTKHDRNINQVLAKYTKKEMNVDEEVAGERIWKQIIQEL